MKAKVMFCPTKVLYQQIDLYLQIGFTVTKRYAVSVPADFITFFLFLFFAFLF